MPGHSSTSAKLLWARVLCRRLSPTSRVLPAQLYSAVLCRLLGDAGDAASSVPRTARPELRPSRFVAYATGLRARMSDLRWWWVLRGALVLAAGSAKLAAGARLLAGLDPAPGLNLDHPFVSFYSAPVAAAVHRAGLVAHASLLRDRFGACGAEAGGVV